jgi:hypothetical protein
MSTAKRFSLQLYSAPLARWWLLAWLASAAVLLLPAGVAHAADRTPFDHLTTGFELIGQHRDLPCESCHVNAIFKGTPKDCAACHGVGTAVRATAKPVSHILTSDRCEACHTPVAWNPAVNFDHAEVRGACSSCHNNVQAQGKGPGHIETSLECNLCHSTIGWAGAVFNHSNVTAGCASCHNGIGAKGPPPTHIPTGLSVNQADPGNAPCEACHTPTNYVTFSGTAMNHPAVIPPLLCAACHEKGMSFFGVTIVTRPDTVKGVVHPATGDCGQCHQSTVSFALGNLQPVGHIPTSQPCALCHLVPGDFTTKTMDHTGVTNGCATCHADGSSFFDMAPLVLVMPNSPKSGHVAFGGAACESCHSNSTFTMPGGFAIQNMSGAAPPAMVHTAVAATPCATCHGAGKTDFGTSPKMTVTISSVNHVPTGSATCDSCHSKSDFSTFVIQNASSAAAPGMVHTVVTSTACSVCHESNLTWVGTVPKTVVTRPLLEASGATHPTSGECSDCHKSTTSFKGASNFPANHIPLLAGSSANCSVCHTNANDYSVFVMSTPGHALVGSVCASCHASGKTFANMPPKILTHPSANHIPVGAAACDSCHSPTAFDSFLFTNASGTVPPAMVHTAVGATTCSTCHEKGKTDSGTPATITRPLTEPHQTGTPPHPISGECSDCHKSTSTFLGATNFPANHIPLTAGQAAPCATCHTGGGDFSVYTMGSAGHALVSPVCATCHATGKTFANMAPPSPLVQPPATHVPFGSAACESCHSGSTFTQPGGFKIQNASATAPPGMVHSAVTGTACITCHGAGKTDIGAVPKTTVTISSVNHIPTGAVACEGCHSSSSFTSFAISPNASGTAPPAMVHSLMTATKCSTCHEAGKTWVGTPATKVRPALKADGTAHVASGECNTCHFNTTSFKGATDLPSNHIPLPAADANNCKLCHLDTTTYSTATMNHVNISNNCMQCHAYGLTFANMAPPTLKQPPSGATGHIPTNPPNSTTQNFACELCHLPTVFTSFAGTVMKHAVVRGMTCMSCHEIGMQWKTNTGVRLWVRDSTNHYKGQDCGGSGCHSTRDKYAARRATTASATAKGGASAVAPALSAAASVGGGAVGFSHRRVAGTACVSCHGPTSGIGMSASHIATSDRCESCHMTAAWLPVTRVDHTQVRGSCASCHNGVAATGRGRNHIPSSDSCETCHTTNAWSPARFDHIGVAAHTCRSCHDSIHATGMPSNHVPTSAQCDTCHGTLGWKPARLDHSTLTATCASCHDNNIALGVTPTHMVTGRDCATCHSYPDWTILHFVHAAAAYPGEHRAALACAACHTSNTDKVPWPSPADAGSCAGCHAKDFRPDLHPRTQGGLKYTASELRDCTGACHVYSDATLGTVSKAMPGPYHRVTDAAFKH